MADFVTVSDLEARYGAPSAPDEQVEQLLVDAEDEIASVLRSAGRDLAADVSSGRLTVTTVQRVACELVNAALLNPSGYRSSTSTKTEGPFSESRSQTYGDGASGMELSARQLRRLGVGGGAFTINPLARR